jgi:uncharacterized protein (DUF2062 family)
VSPRRVVERLRPLLHLDDRPERIALALAVGVFISCTPLLGLQTLLAILVATLFRLHKAALLTGVWLNLPWFAPFVYGAALAVGRWLVPDADGARDAWLAWVVAHGAHLTWRDLITLLETLSLTLLVGTAVVGLVVAGLTYVIAFKLLMVRRRRTARPSRERQDRAA